MFKDVIGPLLARHSHTNVYVTATEKAVPLMLRTGIEPVNSETQFYSDLSFKEKVVESINPS
jgi:hypothetical protein